MRFWKIQFLCALLPAVAFISPAFGSALLELKVKDESFRGKLVARTDDYCWLMDRDGRLSQVKLSQVSEHRKVSGEFRRFTAGDTRDAIRRELGNDFDFAATSHFVVCAPKGRASTYAPVFEEIYRSFYRYLSGRGLKVNEPEFALVAIIFPDQQSFAKYSRQDGVNARPGLMGYYTPTTNRVALYEASAQGRASLETSPVHDGIFANIEANLQDTIVHETTHQVAFNAGLHSRIGESPRWVVEGLATVFESPGVRDPHGTNPKQRINRERFLWFGNFAKTRRKPHSLQFFLSDDSMFKSSALDAYSQAWALTFFLVETRSSAYSKYLRLMSSRDVTRDYTAEERLDDFKKAFGNDLDSLDAQFERFITELN